MKKRKKEKKYAFHFRHVSLFLSILVIPFHAQPFIILVVAFSSSGYKFSFPFTFVSLL